MKNKYSMNAFRKQGIDPREAEYLPRQAIVDSKGRATFSPIVLDPRCGRALYRKGKESK